MTGPERDRPEVGTSDRQDEQGGYVDTDRTTVVGSVVYLGDPELVAAEIIEKRGPDFARKVSAWLILTAEEVG